MIDKERRQNDTTLERGSSKWMTTLPLIEFWFTLNKQEFQDSLRLRYNWPIPRLPALCSCRSKFDTQHAMPYEKGGFVTLRHNKIRDVTATLLSEVCKDVATEPMLLPLTGEEFDARTTNKANEARLDVSATGFGKGPKGIS